VGADVVRRHADDLNGFTLFERRDDLRSPALRLERETYFVFELVIPAQGLLFWSGIDDGFVVDSVLPDGISLGVHDFAPWIRRTEVRSDL
jgi:hypothetical protein